MLQGTLLVIDVDMSFLVILLLFVTSVILLVKTNKGPGNKFIPTAVLTMSIAMFVLLGLNFYQFLVDDVYISLRYARNLANGHGLVFNTDGSHPVEGYTNFLWVLMETVLFIAGFSDETILHVIRVAGILFGMGVVITTYSLMRMLDFEKRTSLIAVLLLCVLPEFSFWSVGGLETMLYMFLMMLSLYVYIYERKSGKDHVWSMFLLFLLAITRPEGLFIAGVIIAYHLIQGAINHTFKQSFYSILAGIILFLVLYGMYFTWRLNMYGYFFPNTFYAKKVADISQLFYRSQEITKFVGPLLPFFAIASIGFFRFHKKYAYERLLFFSVLVTLISFCYLARVEWMPGHRYELPFVPLLLVFFAAGLTKIAYSENRRFTSSVRRYAIPFCLLIFFGGFLMSRFNELRKKGNEFGKQLNRAHVPLGKWLKRHAPANASYASWDMGAVPYFSGLHTIVDINREGLLNSYTTHNGYDIDRLISLSPTFLVLPPNTSYVRPKDILDFYTHPKLLKNYEFLFDIAFTRDYVLHVYKHKDVRLTDLAVDEARIMAMESKRGLFD
jgi:arabinofuranosyltransferase